MLTLSDNSKIYVHAPAGIVTGGVELLHQLVHELRKLGRNAYIVYFGGTEHTVPCDYKEYDVEIAETIEDSNSNVEVYTEVMLHDFRLNQRKTQKFWWWLSVDFFFIPAQTEEMAVLDVLRWDFNRGKRYFLSRMKRSLLQRKNLFANKFRLHSFSDVCCGYQCHYIRDFLLCNGFTHIYPLGDYINEDHIHAFTTKNRNNIVLFNPKKGNSFTRKLIELTPEIKWIALEGMTRSQLRETIQHAKLYIDFGNHPGMDRLPRECAANGCCVITGRRGAAGSDEDVPLPLGFKFDETSCTLVDIVSRIRQVLANYEKEIDEFEEYRKIIASQKNEFIRQVSAIFGKGEEMT